MNIEQAVLEKFRQLAVDKQQELLDFVEFLAQKMMVKSPLRSVRGLCADLKVNITAEDIAEARNEMWGNFPREIIKKI